MTKSKRKRLIYNLVTFGLVIGAFIILENMIAAKADWLYNLPQWEEIYDEETRNRLYREQIDSQTFKREGAKVQPNDPCPCGSGKKYKKCCGK